MIAQKTTRLIPIGTSLCLDNQHMEFHICADLRKKCDFNGSLFASSGNIIFTDQKAVHTFVQKYNKVMNPDNHPTLFLKASQLNAMALIDEIFHYVCRLYRQDENESFFTGAIDAIEAEIGKEETNKLLIQFTEEFPPFAVYTEKTDAASYLESKDADGIPHKILVLEELMLLRLANENPAFEPFFPLFSDKKLLTNPSWLKLNTVLRNWSAQNPPFGPEETDLISMLKAPVEYSPFDLKGQLEYIQTRWLSLLGEWLTRLLSGLDFIAEEEKAGWGGGIGSGTPDMDAYEFDDISKEYERFSPDREWMPNVVLIAKSILVWLSQLTEKYGRPITRLDQIPNEELDFLSESGFTGLWLIGIWERSPASARIKQICGNPEAAASAYSLDDYEIAHELGGWDALDHLRKRAWKRGIRMASDMVPNHTGMDAKWVVEKPDLFIQTRDSPFPGYDFQGENLSHDSRVSIYLDNHYYNKTDCAVVFKRVDNSSGDVRYIYHGNDGTGMPWNDTAQIDFLNPEAREQVIQKILHVAKNFPIIRFDAAMVIAKKHIQRLWYPEPGAGGDIASRSRHAISRDEFERRIPEEFWREVVDRCASEIPDTLLLAEAFWMMEGYFVRTLGMHRVYNSAFMNMLKREDNEKYRTTIKNTIEFDPEILKRYVNFMNNPDEETAAVQFGRDDKYFGVCTMMVAMPGLPMFGHGQIEGFEEKYGMEYRKAYKQEFPDQNLINRHKYEIFPLMKKRYLFTDVENFCLYDFFSNGRVNENVFAWSNRVGNERALILYNNIYEQAQGWIKTSAASAIKNPDGSKTLVQRSLAEALALSVTDNRYCIMQEQRSKLWYIRTTKEIAENGVFAALNGFQTQVFVHIYEVNDTPDFQYRTLYETLAGRGIRDVHMGIQNIFLKDLYTELSNLVSKEFILKIRSFYATDTTETLNSATNKIDSEKFLDDLEPLAIAFYKTALRFITENKATLKLLSPSKVPADLDFSNLWKSCKNSLERLLVIPSLVGKNTSKSSPVSVAKSLDTPESSSFLENIYSTVLSTQYAPEVYAVSLLMLPLADLVKPSASGTALRSLIDLWSLDLKLAEILSDSGIEIEKAIQHLRKLKALAGILETKKPKLKKKDDELSIDAFLPKIFCDPLIAQEAGVHEWDGKNWFNKEAGELLTNALFTMACICDLTERKDPIQNKKSMENWQAYMQTLATLKAQTEKSFEESGYQVHLLPGMAEFFATKSSETIVNVDVDARAKTAKTPKAEAKPAPSAAKKLKKNSKPEKPST